MPDRPAILIVPVVVEHVFRWFREAAEERVEEMVLLLGHRTEKAAIATTAVLPPLRRHSHWYEFDDSGGTFWEALAALDLAVIGQIHTHPGASTRHSPRDDAYAVFDRVGTISIVVPDYGSDPVPLNDPRCTVHERTANGWRIWDENEQRERLRLPAAGADLRRNHLG